MKSGVTIAAPLDPADTRDLPQKYPELPSKKVRLSPLRNNRLLRLDNFLEPRRKEIEAVLPPLDTAEMRV
jgi:hypothetical protein